MKQLVKKSPRQIAPVQNKTTQAKIAEKKYRIGSPVGDGYHSQSQNSNLAIDILRTGIEEYLSDQMVRGKRKVLTGFVGLSVASGKRGLSFYLREGADGQYFRVISYPLDHEFTSPDFEALVLMHHRFRDRLVANVCWKNHHYLLGGSYRKLVTFNDLLDFYEEDHRGKTKITRFRKRYFDGKWGNKQLSLYCAESFRIDFLDRPVPDRQPSDRNELIKLVSAAINKAKQSMNISIDVLPLFRRGERARADNTDNEPPKLSVVSAFILEAYALQEEQLGLSMIIQLLVSLRNANAARLEWGQCKLEDLYVEVPKEKSKTGYVRHPIPNRMINILRREWLNQCAEANSKNAGEPKFVFQSLRKKGKARANFDRAFEKIKASLLDKATSNKKQRAIKKFTRHQIRDLVEELLMSVGTSEGQKEKCLGRKPSDIGVAYANLSLSQLNKIKNKMVKKIEKKEPELKILFEKLSDSEAE